MSEGPSDPHRPRVHLSPPRGWLNDPNGFVRWRGRYHLFFQHHPDRPLWGPPQWAHVVSDDLARWRALPPALTPDMAPADPDGCWSGSTALVDGRPVVHYTGVRDGVQATCRAEPLDDDLVRWAKDLGNPILTAPPDAGVAYGAYRDPYVWREGAGWRMVVGTSLHGRGAAWHYESDDGRAWRPLGPLVDDRLLPTARGQGRIWECPLLLRGDHDEDRPDVLVYGAWDQGALVHVSAFTGRYDGRSFVPDAVHRIDHGDHAFYAPQAIRDGDRWLLIGWIQEQRGDAALLQAGWAGVLSLPREVRVERGGLLHSFAPEVRALRGEEHEVVLAVPAGGHAVVPIEGRAVELRLRVRVPADGAAALDVLATPDGDERTRIVLDARRGTVSIDKTRSTLDPEASRARQVAAHPAMDEEVDLHVIVDGSVLEMIVDGRLAFTTRAYPTRHDATSFVAWAHGGDVRWSGSAWRLGGPVLADPAGFLEPRADATRRAAADAGDAPAPTEG